ncbi:MAG: hypothetical protein IPJ85_14545 [Flavobacteriales bacterium]|nr:hypothetical protein [Flavobacteriales bacterium]
MKLSLGISCTVHGGILVHSSMLYWTSLHLESLIAILLSAALMGISVYAAFRDRNASGASEPRTRAQAVRAREKILRTTFLVLLPLASYYWFVLRPAIGQMTTTQMEAAYALLVFQIVVGVLGEVFLEFLKDIFRHGA